MVRAHWLVVAVITVLVVGAAWLGSRNTVQRYQATATVQINSRKGVIPQLNDLDVEEMALRTDPVASEALVLTTQTLALAVTDAAGLQLQTGDGSPRGEAIQAVRVDSVLLPAAYALHRTGAGWSVRDAAGALVSAGPYDSLASVPGARFAVVPADSGAAVPLTVVPRVAAAATVRAGLSYSVQPNTNIVTVTYTGTDGTIAPLVLNSALQALADYGASRARQYATDRLRYIEERLVDARDRYTASLERMQRYEERQATTDVSAEEIALVGTLQEYERERQRRQVDLATVRSIIGSDTTVSVETVNRLAAAATISTNPAMAFQLENLLRLYDERRTLTSGMGALRESNPQVQSLDHRILQSSKGLLEATRATVRALETSLASLEEQIAGLRARLSSFPGKKSQVAQLQLDVNLQNDTYRYLLAQHEAARIMAATIAPYVQIVEPATAAPAVGVNHREKLVIALAVGLFLGLSAAFLLEYLDRTVRTSADVEQGLDLPLLGVVPLEGVRPAEHGRRRVLPLVALLDPDDPASEAYRSLRTNVTFVNAAAGARSLVITSPGPSEGKSTTAANLAVTMAQQGTRTLLVDADLRRPIVHRAFDLVQDPGLTDVLAGKAQLREAIRPNVAPKLDVLPSGTQPPNPSELLGSDAMRRLLTELRTQYEIVIFDSPPVLAVTDAAVLGAATDAVVVVLRAGETESAAAERALLAVRRVEAKVAGAVLNGVEPGRDRYYHSYYRYRGERRGLLRALGRRLGVGR